MPHVHDKATVRRRCSYTGEQHARARAALDLPNLRAYPPDDAQLAFRSLLAWCLFTDPGKHPTDPSARARSFVDLPRYVEWSSPQRYRLQIGVSVPERVAISLLPFNRRGRFSGVPGLRLDTVDRTGIHLVHLPTGAYLHITGPHAFHPTNLDDEIDYRTSEHVPADFLGHAAELTPAEEQYQRCWQPTDQSPLLAALVGLLAYDQLWDHPPVLAGLGAGALIANIIGDSHTALGLAQALCDPVIGVPSATVEQMAGYVRVHDRAVIMDIIAGPDPTMAALRKLGSRRREQNQRSVVSAEPLAVPSSR